MNASLHVTSSLYVMQADGSGLITLTDNPFDDREFAWSPDSKQLTFMHNGDIYVVNADGSQQRNLTNGAPVDTVPA